MSKSALKKTFAAAVLSLALSFQLVSPASAATNNQIITAAQSGVGYLKASQSADGSVTGFGGVTDWAIIAAVASGQDPASFKNGGASLADWLLANQLTGTALATDIEKRILAIAATGADAADFGGVDYGALLSGHHTDNQLGSTTLLNDDIFGVLAIAAMNDPALLPLAQDALDYLILNQEADGGFSYTTDNCAYCGSSSSMTAAAVMAMLAADSMGLTNSEVSEAQSKAVGYLVSTKQNDGGFGYDIYGPSDGSSTAWVLMALNVLGDDVKAEAQAAVEWLLDNQNEDGGFSYGAFGYTDSDTYTTSHAVTALLGTTWLLQPEPLQPTPAPDPTPTPDPETPNDPAPISNPKPKTPSVPADQDTDEDNEVLSEQTSGPESTQETSESNTGKQKADKIATVAEPKSNRTWFVFLALLVVAVIWVVIQTISRRRKLENSGQ